MMRPFLIILMPILLTSCAVSVEKPTTYMLNETSHSNSHYRTNKILMVYTPDTVSYYHTKQIAYETKPHLIDYFTRNAWAATPSQMLQPLLVKSLQQSKHFRAVVTPVAGSGYQYALNVEITSMFVNLHHQPVTFDVGMRAQIINGVSNKAIATKDFYVSEPIACSNQFYSRIVAANHAVARVLQQITKFSVRTIK